MKILVRSLGLLKIQQGSEPTSSLLTITKQIFYRGRLFLRAAFRGNGADVSSEKSKTVFLNNLLFTPGHKALISSGKDVGSGFLSKYTSSRLQSLAAKVFSKCISNSIAANLRRNAARKLMCQGINGVPLICFVGFTLAKESSLLSEKDEFESVSWKIRDIFCQFLPQSTVINGLIRSDTESLGSLSVDDIEFDRLLAKGCNAAVYSAAWKNQKKELFKDEDNETVLKLDDSIMSFNIENFETESPLQIVTTDTEISKYGNKEFNFPIGSLLPYNLAVKMMFNYNAESNASAIWRAMNKEIIPARMGFLSKETLPLMNWSKKSKLSPHPNIVDMQCAFSDSVPALPEAFDSYPDALPSRLNGNGLGRNMTLFLVMKRYHCSLAQYLESHQLSAHTSLLILTQLLEGIVHLGQQQIAHRDLKVDNILVDLTWGVSNPMTAITDFGCCIENFALSYPTIEVDKGGNIALMAPEVVTAEPGPFSTIDYSRADLWTVGAIAYEIFGTSNPFYNSKHNLQSSSYREDSLPPLPGNVSSVVKKLVSDLLRRNPKERPKPSLAATVCQLLLFSSSERNSIFIDFKNSKMVLQWLVNLAAITFCQIMSEQASKISPAELQLRHTFLSRVQLSEVIEALKYIKSA